MATRRISWLRRNVPSSFGPWMRPQSPGLSIFLMNRLHMTSRQYARQLEFIGKGVTRPAEAGGFINENDPLKKQQQQQQQQQQRQAYPFEAEKSDTGIPGLETGSFSLDKFTADGVADIQQSIRNSRIQEMFFKHHVIVRDLKALCASLGVQHFDRWDLLLKALTHSTYAERHLGMEYYDQDSLGSLGRQVIDVCAAWWIYDPKQFPLSKGSRYDQNTEYKAQLFAQDVLERGVCVQTAVDCSNAIHLTRYVRRLLRKDYKQPGREVGLFPVLRKSLVALVGAVFLDQDFGMATRAVDAIVRIAPSTEQRLQTTSPRRQLLKELELWAKEGFPVSDLVEYETTIQIDNEAAIPKSLYVVKILICGKLVAQAIDRTDASASWWAANAALEAFQSSSFVPQRKDGSAKCFADHWKALEVLALLQDVDLPKVDFVEVTGLSQGSDNDQQGPSSWSASFSEAFALASGVFAQISDLQSTQAHSTKVKARNELAKACLEVLQKDALDRYYAVYGRLPFDVAEPPNLLASHAAKAMASKNPSKDRGSRIWGSQLKASQQSSLESQKDAFYYDQDRLERELAALRLNIPNKELMKSMILSEIARLSSDVHVRNREDDALAELGKRVLYLWAYHKMIRTSGMSRPWKFYYTEVRHELTRETILAWSQSVGFVCKVRDLEPSPNSEIREYLATVRGFRIFLGILHANLGYEAVLQFLDHTWKSWEPECKSMDSGHEARGT